VLISHSLNILNKNGEGPLIYNLTKKRHNSFPFYIIVALKLRLRLYYSLLINKI
jgi:hypothetical protein